MKQRFKPSFLGFTVDEYERLRDYGLTNQAINVLRHSPERFFMEFSRYARTVPEEFHRELYSFCFQTVKNNNIIKFAA